MGVGFGHPDLKHSLLGEDGVVGAIAYASKAVERRNELVEKYKNETES
jgi:hypothetical protein